MYAGVLNSNAKFEMMPHILPLNLQTKAINELHEVPSRLQEDLEKLREWLKKQPHLKVRDDDQSLLLFLRGCKFSLQTTKKKLDFYYASRSLVPEFYDNRDPLLPDIQNILNAGFYYVLPTLHDNGTRIVIWDMSNCDPKTMPYPTLVKVCNMFLDVLINEDDDAIVSGITAWMEFTNCSLQYVPQLVPTTVNKHVKITEKALPLRIKGFHITCTSGYLGPLIELVDRLMKSLLSGKLLQRSKFHRDMNSFYSDIPQRLLPVEYGGNNGSLEELKLVGKKQLESYRDWFLEDTKYGTQESLRVEDKPALLDIFGVEGSFRKLEVD